jgi:hypothetical protein
MPPLTAKRAAIIRQSVKESYRRQFEERLKHEAAIKKEEAKLKPLIDAYRKANLLSDTLGPVGLNKGYSYDQKLSLLYKFTNKMLRDTGRSDYKNLKGYRPKKTLLISDIINGAKIYFGNNGKKRYLAYIKEKFGKKNKKLPIIRLSIGGLRPAYGLNKLLIVINNRVATSTVPANISFERSIKRKDPADRSRSLIKEKAAEFHGVYNLKTGHLTGDFTSC